MIRVGLKVRLLGTLLVLIVGLQLTTSYIVLERTRRDVDASAKANLEAGGRVFARLLRDRERQLLTNVAILVSDFGLRGAVATGDRPTIESALANHADRIAAALAFYVDLDGKIKAMVPSRIRIDSDDSGLRALVVGAVERKQASGTTSVGGTPYQIVLAPVKAPRTIGWIGMGFELDRRLASDLRTLTGLEVTFWSQSSTDGPPNLASTLADADHDRLADSIAREDDFTQGSEPFLLESSGWITLPIVISALGDSAVGVVLQTSHENAMSPFAAQRAGLLTIFAIGLVLALAASLWVAGRLTGPLASLARAATAMTAGNLHVELHAIDSRDEIGDLARTFELMQGAVVEREQRILHEGLHDRLTGLPNRGSIETRIRQRLEAGEEFSVVLFDIVRLKDVNGTLGSSIGDAMLVQTGQRLREIEEVSWVARLAGDEFLALVETATDVDIDVDEDIVKRVEAIITRIEAPHEVRGMQVALDFSAGVVIAPGDGCDAETLLRRAEMAVSLSKQAPTRIARYAPGLEEAHQRRVGIMIELERALENGDLELHYQPKVEIRTRRVIGAEALIRWTHAEMGRMNPEEFIGIAEQTGFIGRISEWVLREATEQIARWKTRGIELVLSINLSAYDAAEESLPDRIQAALREVGADPHSLKIEITESAVMSRPDEAAALLQRIRDLGVGVSIDDFGTGHSSLAQLKALPSDELKIDQAFVRHLRENTPDEVIVRTTIELAHSLGLEVVAEGIEDRIAWRILERHGCDVGQGYWIGRPMCESEFVAWLDRFEKDDFDG